MEAQPKKANSPEELKAEVERLSRELAAAQQERSQSAAYGLELLCEKENLQRKYESIEGLYEESKRELQELREAWDKAVAEQRVSATSVFEKEVQLLNDSDALAASFTVAKQEIEKELKQTKSQLESTTNEKDRYLGERDELAKRVSALEQERKTLRVELKDLKARETRLFNENSELEEENVSLQKQVSNLRSTQVEFESSKHEIQRLQDDIVALNSQLEEVENLRRISERQMQDALEGLQSEREQKHALRKELDKRITAVDPLINWTSLAALKNSPHLTNLALRNYSTPNKSSTLNRETEDGSPNSSCDPEGWPNFSDAEQGYDMIPDIEMPLIEGSLFDEVHQTEIKKLQQNLEDKENQRSDLDAKMVEIQNLKDMLYKKQEQLKQLRTILKSNKESAEVALKNLKSKYDMEKAIVAETMTKLRLEHKRLNEDAATFASLRSHFSARIEEYNTEIEKLQSKLAASEQEKNTLNSILRMAIEQKVMLTQKVEALEMDRENPQLAAGNNSGNSNQNNSGSSGHNNNNTSNKNPSDQQVRSGGGLIRGGGRGNSNRNTRPPRASKSGSGNERR